VGREDADGALNDARRLLLVHRAEAAPLTIALARGRTHDAFEPLAVGPDGALYELHTDEAGVTVLRWALPAARGGAR